MPITPFLGDQTFDPETTRIMGVAFEMARAAVKRDWGGLYANHSIAKRIIELAKMASAILMYFANRRSATFCGEYVGTRGQGNKSWRPNASERPPVPRNMRPRVLTASPPAVALGRLLIGGDLRMARIGPPSLQRDDKGRLQGR